MTMIIDITAADQMTNIGNVPNGYKMDIQLAVYGSGAGTVEVQITRPGNGTPRTVASYAANTSPDDLLTIVGPALTVAVGIPLGGTYTSGTINVDVAPLVV